VYRPSAAADVSVTSTPVPALLVQRVEVLIEPPPPIAFTPASRRLEMALAAVVFVLAICGYLVQNRRGGRGEAAGAHQSSACQGFRLPDVDNRAVRA
jgi:hypothetical protein